MKCSLFSPSLFFYLWCLMFSHIILWNMFHTAWSMIEFTCFHIPVMKGKYSVSKSRCVCRPRCLPSSLSWLYCWIVLLFGLLKASRVVRGLNEGWLSPWANGESQKGLGRLLQLCHCRYCQCTNWQWQLSVLAYNVYLGPCPSLKLL